MLVILKKFAMNCWPSMKRFCELLLSALLLGPPHVSVFSVL